jgi:hypothetical protein
MKGDMWFSSEALLARFEAQLQARRELVSRLLARKPVTHIQERHREALIKRALSSVETRSRFANAYTAHLEALQQELAKEASDSPSISGTTGSSTTTKGDLGDY